MAARTADDGGPSPSCSASPSLPAYSAPTDLLFAPLIRALSSPRNITTAAPIRNQILSDLVTGPSDARELGSIEPVRDPWQACTSRRGIRCLALGDVPEGILSRAGLAKRRRNRQVDSPGTEKWGLVIVFRDQSSSSSVERAIGLYVWISEEPDLYRREEVQEPTEYRAKPRSCHLQLSKRAASPEALRILDEAVLRHVPRLCAHLLASDLCGGLIPPDKVELKVGSVEQAWAGRIEELCARGQLRRKGDETSQADPLFRVKWANPCFSLRMGGEASREMLNHMEERRFGGLVLSVKEHGSGATEVVLRRDERKGSGWRGTWVVKLVVLLGLYAMQLEPQFKAVLALVVLLFPASSVVEERVLVSASLGIQRTEVRTSHLIPGRLSETSKLFTRDRILDVLMTESFHRFKVADHVVVACTDRMVGGGADAAHRGAKYGGAEGTKGETGRTIVLFPSLQPRLPLVKHAYRIIHTALYSDASSRPRWRVSAITPSEHGVVRAANKIPFSLAYVKARAPMGVMVRDLDGLSDAAAKEADADTAEDQDGYPEKRAKGAPAAWCYPHAEMSMAALHVAEPYRRLNHKLSSAGQKQADKRDAPRSYISSTSAASHQPTSGRAILTSISPALFNLQRTALLLSGALPRLAVLEDGAKLAPVYADTAYGNDAAAAFFERMGFRRTRENAWLGLEIGLRDVLLQGDV